MNVAVEKRGVTSPKYRGIVRDASRTYHRTAWQDDPREAREEAESWMRRFQQNNRSRVEE